MLDHAARSFAFKANLSDGESSARAVIAGGSSAKHAHLHHVIGAIPQRDLSALEVEGHLDLVTLSGA